MGLERENHLMLNVSLFIQQRKQEKSNCRMPTEFSCMCGSDFNMVPVV